MYTLFYINGKIIDSGINDRVLAIDIDSYKKIPIRIGVASGPEKLSAIVGASRGGLINVLITSFQTANALLEMLK
jgi:DNA-binding transcriptional regulator LsrR (DeoR family)